MACTENQRATVCKRYGQTASSLRPRVRRPITRKAGNYAGLPERAHAVAGAPAEEIADDAPASPRLFVSQLSLWFLFLPLVTCSSLVEQPDDWMLKVWRPV